jgi:multiple sugar transport system ATP-binding protein
VTHDQVEAMAMADRIAVMNHGVVDQIGSPQEIYDRPLTMHVAGFIGSPAMNFLDLHTSLRIGQRSVRLNGDSIPVPEVHEDREDAQLALGVRPEHISLVPEGGVRAQVFGTEYLGTSQVVTLDTAHGRVKARVPSSVPVRQGDRVGLRFRDDRLVLFDTASGTALRSELFAPHARMEETHA